MDKDVEVVNHGTIVMFTPVTDAGREWLGDYCPDGEWFGGGLVVDHRYAESLASAITTDGLRVE